MYGTNVKRGDRADSAVQTDVKKAPVIKFLSIMQPAEHPEVKLEVNIKKTEDGAFAVNGKFYFEAITFFKFKGHFDEQV